MTNSLLSCDHNDDITHPVRWEYEQQIWVGHYWVLLHCKPTRACCLILGINKICFIPSFYWVPAARGPSNNVYMQKIFSFLPKKDNILLNCLHSNEKDYSMNIPVHTQPCILHLSLVQPPSLKGDIWACVCPSNKKCGFLFVFLYPPCKLLALQHRDDWDVCF